jgi:predicted nucleic-acid-binding Zn-ribbon protein
MKKWIKLSRARMCERFKCPECGQTVYTKTTVQKYDGRRETVCFYPLCPWCGAKNFRSDCIVAEGGSEI